MLRNVLLAQLLCLMIWQATAAGIVRPFDAPESQTGGIMPSREFINDMCRAMNDDFQMVPWPLRMDGFCDNMGLNTPNSEEALCPLFDVVKMMLGYVTSQFPYKCAPDGISHPSSRDSSGKGLLLPTPFPSQLGALGTPGMPPSFPPAVASALMQSEGPSYYWLFKHIQRLFAWVPCEAMGQKAPWTPPEGWQHLHMLGSAAAASAALEAPEAPETPETPAEDTSDSATGSETPESARKKKQMPFGAVLRRASSPATQASCRTFLQTHPVSQHASRRDMRSNLELCAGDELVVLIRGTSSEADWAYNMDYSLIKNAEYGQGLLHRGFLKLTDSLWGGQGGLKSVLDQNVGSVSSVTIAGHSLGAASAALLAARAQKYLASSQSASAPQVTAVLFASPNVGDAAFTSDFNSRVNTRNIAFNADIVPQVPCAGSMVDCTASLEAISRGTSQSAPGTSQQELTGNFTVRSSLPYERLGGRLVLTAGDMPYQKDAWSQLSVYTQDEFCDNMMSIGALFEATHVCSYMCALSAFSPADKGDWCLLWGTPEEAKMRQKSGILAIGGGPTYCSSGYSTMSEEDFPAFPLFPSVKEPEWLSQQPLRKGPQNKQQRRAAPEQPAAGHGDHGGHGGHGGHGR